MNTDSIVLWATRLSIVDWVCSKTSGFAGDLEDSKSTSGGVLCIFGSRTFVPIGWMCEKQTSVSHSSTESEIISMDYEWMDFIALDLWDVVIEVLRSTTSTIRPIGPASGNWCGTGTHSSIKNQVQNTNLPSIWKQRRRKKQPKC